MLAENKTIVQLVDVRTLERSEVTFRASPLSTSKETKKKKSGHVQTYYTTSLCTSYAVIYKYLSRMLSLDTSITTF